jgi:hypothetical protein
MFGPFRIQGAPWVACPSVVRQPYRLTGDPEAGRPRAIARIRTASPCEAAWSAMQPVGDGVTPGHERSRRCGDCNRCVHDLSGMTAPRAAALLESAEGKPCTELYRRADGRMLTSDCPVGRSVSLRRSVVTAAIVACAMLAAGLVIAR